MNSDVELHIKHGYTWTKLPSSIRQLLGNSQTEYENAILEYSIKNQLIYKGNLIKQVCKDQKKYYEDLLRYSRQHLMLYPYHLSEFMIRGLRVTPFSYYHSMIQDIMTQEKSYDSLPNFTAADCVRLLGIGRNQYIDLMNSTKSSRVSKLFQLKRRPDKNLLPTMVVENFTMEPWWIVKYSFISEDDVKLCKHEEKILLDDLINYYEEKKEYKSAGSLDYKSLLGLYRKGFVYLDVPVYDSDCIIVPPLEGFVMNRVLGDYFETLLYKIFISQDEHTSVRELASMLEIDISLVQNAISVYCRLGFAKKKNWDMPAEGLNASWGNHGVSKQKEEANLLIDWADLDIPDGEDTDSQTQSVNIENLSVGNMTESINSDSSPLIGMTNSQTSNQSKRIAFLFDSTLTAFLMMGNLSPGLKNHAVTMFEVGKLSDETMDSFISELEKVGSFAEGEARRYFDHAITLRDTILFLRNNKDLSTKNYSSLGLDLLRCESLLGLDPQVCRKLLNKNYEILISMAPLSNEIRSISSCVPQHLGPPIPEVNSLWFKLFLYHITGNGPPSLFLPKGSKLRKLPSVFKRHERVLITTWGHDPSILPMSNLLYTLQECLNHSAVLIQAYSKTLHSGVTRHISFPLDKEESLSQHPAITALCKKIDLLSTCGYITLLNTEAPSEQEHLETISDYDSGALPSEDNLDSWVLLDCCFGIPLFDSQLNKDICNKIMVQKLLDSRSLNSLLESSRRLSLELLEFITEQQVPTNYLSEYTALSSMSSTPLPTEMLYFNGEKISKWL